MLVVSQQGPYKQFTWDLARDGIERVLERLGRLDLADALPAAALARLASAGRRRRGAVGLSRGLVWTLSRRNWDASVNEASPQYRIDAGANESTEKR